MEGALESDACATTTAVSTLIRITSSSEVLMTAEEMRRQRRLKVRKELKVLRIPLPMHGVGVAQAGQPIPPPECGEQFACPWQKSPRPNAKCLEKVQGGNGHIPGCDKTLGELLRGEVADLEGANNWAGDPLLPDLGFLTRGRARGDADRGSRRTRRGHRRDQREVVLDVAASEARPRRDSSRRPPCAPAPRPRAPGRGSYLCGQGARQRQRIARAPMMRTRAAYVM